MEQQLPVDIDSIEDVMDICEFVDGGMALAGLTLCGTYSYEEDVYYLYIGTHKNPTIYNKLPDAIRVNGTQYTLESIEILNDKAFFNAEYV